MRGGYGMNLEKFIATLRMLNQERGDLIGLSRLVALYHFVMLTNFKRNSMGRRWRIAELTRFNSGANLISGFCYLETDLPVG